MKKILVLASFLFLFSTAALRGQAALLVLIFGEKVATENFYFSLKVGVNYSMITNHTEGNNRFGANFGLVNNIRLGDKWYLMPEFLPLSSKGLKNIPVLTTGIRDLDSNLTYPESTDPKLSYLDIPVLVQYRLTDRWHLALGPQVSFLTGAVDAYEAEPLDGINVNTEIDISEPFRGWDLGFAVDLTYVVSPPKGGKGMNLFLRYSRGFLDLLKDDSNNQYYNSFLQFGAVFPFVENPEKKGK